MCELTPTIEKTFWDREQNGPGSGRQDRMAVILSHVATGECPVCINEMRRVFDEYKADQAAGGSFPMSYGYIGVVLLCTSFMFGLIGRAGIPVGPIPPSLAVLGVGSLFLHGYVRRRT